jgi:outer membrane protein assembly factor BamB
MTNKIKCTWLIALMIPFLMKCSSPQPETRIQAINPESESMVIKYNNSDDCQWRGPNRDGIYPASRLITEWPGDGPEVIWTFEGLGMGYSSAAVTSDRIFTAGTIDSISYVFAISLDGKQIWRSRLGPEWMKTFPGIRSTPLIHQGKGYVVNGLGVLYCFETNSGEIVWTKDLLTEFNAKNIQHGINENLLIDGEKLFCTPGGKENNVVALDKNTGELIWTSKGNGESSAYCSPMMIELGGNKLFITMTAKSLLCINAGNGDVVWIHPLDGSKYGTHANTPIYRDGYLFVQDGFETGCFMLKLSEDGHSFQEIWKNSLLDETNGHAVVIGDNIYGSAESKKCFVCLDWNTGEVKYKSRKISEGTVIAADGMLYCLTYGGEFSLVKPTLDGYEVVSSFRAPGEDKEHITHPVIKNGRLYVRHKNMLTVYNISKV